MAMPSCASFSTMAMSTMMLNTPTPTTTNSSSASYATPLLMSKRPIRPPPRRAGTSIRSSADGGRDDAPNKFDRRNVLLGLGGMYGATAAAGIARGDPVQPPDLTACHRANYPDGFGDKLPVPCCPPYDLSKPLNIQPYTLPKVTKVRVRKPVQNLNKKEIETFKNAVKAMKALDENNDPWSFAQQAKIHCAYCNDGYDQKGFAGVPLQIHFSWLFPPWHRWELYFFEKILGKLIGDDTFALPFWNYDCEDGMTLPDIYKDVASSLYNPNRNLRHNDQIMPLDWGYDKQDTPVPPTVVADNLKLVAELYKEDNLNNPLLFIGSPARAGQVVDQGNTDSTSGKLELLHNIPHMWVGRVEPPNIDMGNFYSTARDALFYAHHAQVDRLWERYRVGRGHAPETVDTDWLDAKYLFYDEDRRLVTVTTRQCLDIGAMGYEIQGVNLPCVPKPTGIPAQAPAGSPAPFGPSRKKLDSNICVTVQRPKKSRTSAEKAREAEVLSVDGIEFTTPDAVVFDVFLSNSKQNKTERVGIFSRVRHNHLLADGSLKRMSFKEGITSSLERIGADDDPTVVVTIVPRTGNVTIGGVHIELVPNQTF